MPETISVGRMRVNGVIDPGLVMASEGADGVELLNFPVKILREQILECQNCLPGGEFVSVGEIKKSLPGWNGSPITIDHPRDSDGDLEFANRDAKFLESVKVGFIDNARFVNGFLWVDAHLSRILASTTTEGRGIVAALLGDGPDVEVSTGYGMELDFRSGSFEDQRYHYTQSDIHPDHLALLPIGMVGACSIEDGCGAARAAQATLQAVSKEDEMADENKINALAALFNRILGASKDDAADPPSGTLNTGELSGGTSPLDEDGSMDRDKIVSALVASEKVDFSQEELNSFGDERLTALTALAGCGCSDASPTLSANSEGTPVEGEADDDIQQVGSDAAIVAPAFTPEVQAALDKVIAFADKIPALEALVNNAQAAHDVEHEALVAGLVANGRCAVSEEDLKPMALSALRGMKRSFETVDYSGRGGPRSLGITADDDGGYMPMPDIAPANAVAVGGDS